MAILEPEYALGSTLTFRSHEVMINSDFFASKCSGCASLNLAGEPVTITDPTLNGCSVASFET
jgi:hypothetical protein